MQEVFKNIIGKLEVKAEHCLDMFEWRSQSELEDAIEIVKQAEAEYKGGWIPCSERLPIGEEFKIKVNGKTFYKQMLVTAEDIDISYEIAFYDQYEEEWVDKNGFYVDVIAWKPLPEPYREERCEE